ncbi:hypothetical protein [Kitasatospora sp. NPDC005748]|uniref:hypothetical protein n=1 Tax=Kitasatospora sp. NPDC005748 TaxID=3157063 RepID=UPI0033FC8088
MDIDQQLATAEGRLTELQLAFVAALDDPARRREIVTETAAVRRQIAELYELLPA